MRLGLKGKGFSQRRDWFSNSETSSAARRPDVATPGVSILAAYPPMGTKHGSGYAFLLGTSMACPHATGIVALIKSTHPNWSPAAIRSALVTTGVNGDQDMFVVSVLLQKKIYRVNRILQDVQFKDQKWFKQFVSQSKARTEERLRGSGDDIVAARMGAKLNVAGWISKQMGGVRGFCDMTEQSNSKQRKLLDIPT
ncbi:unnamed protein product [Camellia sinensis]